MQPIGVARRSFLGVRDDVEDLREDVPGADLAVPLEERFGIRRNPDLVGPHGQRGGDDFTCVHLSPPRRLLHPSLTGIIVARSDAGGHALRFVARDTELDHVA